MEFLKAEFLILIALASTFSWAAPPRISSDPRTNCELLLMNGRQHTLPGAKKSIQSAKIFNELTFMTYNLRNFFNIHQKFRQNGIVSKKMRSEISEAITQRGKTVEELRAQARLIDDENTDVFIGQEIDGEGMLREFTQDYLGKKFVPFVMQENTPRKVTAVVKDIGHLFNPELPFILRAYSHRQLSFRNPENGELFPLFFRDLPVIELWNAYDYHAEAPSLILISAHLKSKKRKPGEVDDRDLREAQFAWIASIIENRREKYGEDVPIIVAGDFNTDVNGNNGMLNRFFARTKLVNPFNLDKFILRSRTTHIHFFKDGNNPPEVAQLDAFLISQSLADRVRDIRVLPHRDSKGNIRHLPKNHAQKELDLSDHYPVKMVLDTKGLF